MRKGMAGITVVVIVLGFMMYVATSHNIIIQSEAAGQGAKENYAKAYFAALAGVHFTVSRLRGDSEVNTFSTLAALRLFFAYHAPCADAASGDHYKKFAASSGNTDFLLLTGAIAKEFFFCDSTFPTNTEVDATEYKFVLSSYPGAVPDSDYWVKSQGTYKEKGSEIEYTSQVWAFIEINNTEKSVTLKKFGRMPVQTLTPTTGASIKDFWDWQDKFY